MGKMASFIAGFGGGYLKADRQRSEDERQAKKDAQDTQLFDARMADVVAAQAARKEESDFKAANIAAQSSGKTDAGFQVTDAAGSNAFTKDADAAAMLGDMAAAKNTGVRENDATRVSTGRTGATMQGTVAGNQVFSSPIQAQAFAKTQAMTDYTKMKSRQEVAEQFGKMDLSDEIRGKLTKLESEGAFKAFRLAQSGDLEGAAQAYDGTGNRRLPQGAKFVSNEVEDPTTKIKRQVISVIGADGKTPLVADLDQALRAYLSPEARYTLEANDRKFTLDERKTTVAEKAEATRALAQAANERKIDGMLAGLIGGRRSGGSGDGSGGPSGNSPALKDRRDFLSDFSGSLPDPETANTPEEAQAISVGNQKVLAQADAVFSTNAELGNILTAPQAAAAMRLAQDPSNIKRVRDNNTGVVYETVAVNGKPVIIGAGGMKQPVAEKPNSRPVTVTPKPKAPMQETLAKTYQHAGYETVQGAIDGAKRGDQKAIVYVEQIQNSGLPIQQREQIKNILSGK